MNAEPSHSKTWPMVMAIGLALLVAIAGPLIPGLASPFGRVLPLFEAGGDIFLRLLKMLVVPLVVCSVMAGVLGLGDVRKLRRPAALTLLFFFVTTLIAVGIGLLCVNAIRPGDHAALPEESATAAVTARLDHPDRPKDTGAILANVVRMLFTDNLFASAAKMDLLPLIFFAMVFAGLLTTRGTAGEPLKKLIFETNELLLQFVLLIMRVAPLGIFCLVVGRFGEKNLKGQLTGELVKTAWYMGTIVSGLAIQVVVLLILYSLFTRRSPWQFLRDMSRSLLTAFSTASSNATLPITMECAIDLAGISRQASDFVIPLGATINMNGTALYEAGAALFIAQALDIPLTFMDQIVIALTATLAAIGAAGIPEAGLVTMVIVLNAVGLPESGMAMILSVDWLLDRFRTTVNVFGDAVGAAVVDPAFRSVAGSEPIPAADS